VRRLIAFFVCTAFALSLHASVPASAPFHQGPATLHFDQQTNVHHGNTAKAMAITAAPADNKSFLKEFFGNDVTGASAKRQRPSMFQRLTSTLKRPFKKLI
jgi:hypothetical protein